MDTVCLHLPIKLLLLRRDPKMVHQTWPKRETGVPCLTPAPVAGSCQPPPTLPGWVSTRFCPRVRGVFADLAALKWPNPRPRFARSRVPFAGRRASVRERERFPRFTFSPFVFDFPKGIARQPEPSSALLHPARAQARALATVSVGGWKTLPQGSLQPPCCSANLSAAREHWAPVGYPASPQRFGPGCREQQWKMLFRKPHCTFSHRMGSGGRFFPPPGTGTGAGAVLPLHGYLPRPETAFCSLSVLQECFAQHEREDFPAPWPSALCPGTLPWQQLLRTPFLAIRNHVVFFLHPPRCTFLVVMCLSVPLSTIQTFPLFLSFGIFFISPPVAFWVLKGSAPSRDLLARPWDRHCPGPRRSVPSLAILAVPDSGDAREGLSRGPRSPMKHLPQLQPSTFQREARTCWRWLRARRVLIPHRVWHVQTPLKPPKR